MIVISSMRPFAEDAEWKRNQLLAFRSWQVAATRVVLFGEREPSLEGSRVEFVQSDQFPRIRDMMLYASRQLGKLCAICNGDILLEKGISRMEYLLRKGRYRCAYSRRWHFNPNLPMEEAKFKATLTNADGLDDRGQDVFMTSHGVWKALATSFDPNYRIGHVGWDGALNYAIRRFCGQERCLNFTELKLVYHPHHGGRKMPHADTIPAPV